MPLSGFFSRELHPGNRRKYFNVYSESKMAKNVQRVTFLKNNIVVIKKFKLNFGQVYEKIINQRKNRHS